MTMLLTMLSEHNKGRAVIFYKLGGEVLKFVRIYAVRKMLPEQLSDSIVGLIMM
ncbi:MAG: hypothetical protein J7623_09460 [Chitinophaga sp.]|uniref:hypothetical protein n=1 Tax=Chitinophaga sp. TaxID=1869181 RepID=UPI001B243E18|nr:hypothetical protein [Chitinophaga sp.]MBO9728851.1 hypothetical protein [Chitinophaga sp.]